MGKVRVYELAKELKVSSKDLMELLAEMGIQVRNHMSALEDEAVERVRDALGGDDAPAAPDVPAELEVEVEEEEIPRKALEKKGRPKGKDGRPKRARQRKREERRPEEEKAPKEVELPPQLTVQELATRLGKPGSQIVKLLFADGIMAGLNQSIEFSTAAQVAQKLGVTVTRAQLEPEAAPAQEEDRPEDLRERPRWSRLWGMWTTARPRSSTPSGIPASPSRRRAASPSTSVLRWWSTKGAGLSSWTHRGTKPLPPCGPGGAGDGHRCAGGGGRRWGDAADGGGDQPRQGSRGAHNRGHQQDG